MLIALTPLLLLLLLNVYDRLSLLRVSPRTTTLLLLLVQLLATLIRNETVPVCVHITKTTKEIPIVNFARDKQENNTKKNLNLKLRILRSVAFQLIVSSLLLAFIFSCWEFFP